MHCIGDTVESWDGEIKVEVDGGGCASALPPRSSGLLSAPFGAISAPFSILRVLSIQLDFTTLVIPKYAEQN